MKKIKAELQLFTAAMIVVVMVLLPRIVLDWFFENKKDIQNALSVVGTICILLLLLVGSAIGWYGCYNAEYMCTMPITPYL